ncbi:hypothetical protein LN040_09905 [Desulfovibrio subterraneus]|uniref:hypothetical protein n=1 Tax=Desulfovibrio subterraneus TaxID=2718620 RepID=UPI0022B8E703|nr:hypothetical protein [Desulfovibrio subterraneus]WBF66046.1 hypothetical protein LN040_09905 [Desulfovibrio subterraneus]
MKKSTTLLALCLLLISRTAYATDPEAINAARQCLAAIENLNPDFIKFTTNSPQHQELAANIEAVRAAGANADERWDASKLIFEEFDGAYQCPERVFLKTKGNIVNKSGDSVGRGEYFEVVKARAGWKVRALGNRPVVNAMKERCESN